MYNRYLNNDEFILLDPEPQTDVPGHPAQNQDHANQHRQNRSNQPRCGQNGSASRYMGPSPSKNDLVREITGGLGQLLEGVRKHFSLENFDTGDILLVLIILFLYLEGDNLELVITLGLMLLLGLGDDEPQPTGI